MMKPVVVAAAALAIAGSSIVYAQQRFGEPGGDGGTGIGGLSPGSIARGVYGFGRKTWLRAIAVSSRWQCRLIAHRLKVIRNCANVR